MRCIVPVMEHVDVRGHDVDEYQEDTVPEAETWCQWPVSVPTMTHTNTSPNTWSHILSPQPLLRLQTVLTILRG